MQESEDSYQEEGDISLTFSPKSTESGVESRSEMVMEWSVESVSEHEEKTSVQQAATCVAAKSKKGALQELLKAPYESYK